MDTEIKTKEDVAVLITAYNEAKILGCLLENIPSTYHVYVVDDGSTDETSRIASKHRAEVVALPINIGQGAASVAGYKLLAEMDYDYLIKMDGDGQHDPGEIPKMIRKLEESDADIVVGSRVLGSTHNEAPLLRRLFLSPVTKLINYLTGYRLTDSMSAFKVYRGDILSPLAEILESVKEPQYSASEFWIRFAEADLEVVECPMDLRKRGEGKSHKGLVAFRYGFGIIRTILRAKLDLQKVDSDEH